MAELPFLNQGSASSSGNNSYIGPEQGYGQTQGGAPGGRDLDAGMPRPISGPMPFTTGGYSPSPAQTPLPAPGSGVGPHPGKR